MDVTEKIYQVKNLAVLTIVFLFGFASCKTNSEEQKNPIQEKPNVIIVITDDQGYGDLGCHGNTLIQTPHLDEFHKESIRLTNFHVSPTCAPTRAALMTGRFANRTGVWHTVGGWSLLREGEKTMADMFNENGYATGAFGKWHLGDNYPFRPFERGFSQTVMHGGGGVQQTPDHWDNDYFDDTYFKNGIPEKYEGYCTDVFFNEAISFIQENKEKPFFCYISTNAPHGPYNVPLSYAEMYKDTELTSTQKRFYGMITNVDDNFGKLRKSLTDLGIADNTILIFMTDNGTAQGIRNLDGKQLGFNSSMRGTKGSEYDGGHRVPLFIYWKNGKVSGGHDINELTAHIDILPTLAELCGTNLPKNHKNLDGSSLTSLIMGESTDLNDRILFTDSQRVQYPEKWKQTAVMKGDWRLVNGTELYNLKNDPSQEQNVYGENDALVQELHGAYDSMWSSMTDSFDEVIHIPVGAIDEPVVLTAHDWHTKDRVIPWNQIMIRNATPFNTEKAYWSINVQEAGPYTIELFRYPPESGLALGATAEGVSLEELPGLEHPIPEGKSLEFTQAHIKIDDEQLGEKRVSASEQKVSFSIELSEGNHQLEAMFTDKDGGLWGAFYVQLGKTVP